MSTKMARFACHLKTDINSNNPIGKRLTAPEYRSTMSDYISFLAEEIWRAMVVKMERLIT